MPSHCWHGEEARGGVPDHHVPAPTAGSDWARDDHAVSVGGPEGREQRRFTVSHTGSGLASLVHGLQSAGVAEVARERPDGPVIDSLLAVGFTVFVIRPGQLKSLRRRYWSAGNKDDRFDACVLADTLRTDRHRLRPLTPDGPATVTLRMTVRVRKDLVATRGSLANQLRAHLQVAFPGTVGLFRPLDSRTSPAFLDRFPTHDKADWLSPKRQGAWLRSVG